MVYIILHYIILCYVMLYYIICYFSTLHCIYSLIFGIVSRGARDPVEPQRGLAVPQQGLPRAGEPRDRRRTQAHQEAPRQTIANYIIITRTYIIIILLLLLLLIIIIYFHSFDDVILIIVMEIPRLRSVITAALHQYFREHLAGEDHGTAHRDF